MREQKAGEGRKAKTKEEGKTSDMKEVVNWEKGRKRGECKGIEESKPSKVNQVKEKKKWEGKAS